MIRLELRWEGQLLFQEFSTYGIMPFSLDHSSGPAMIAALDGK
jgi:hypothetical protein